MGRIVFRDEDDGQSGHSEVQQTRHQHRATGSWKRGRGEKISLSFFRRNILSSLSENLKRKIV